MKTRTTIVTVAREAGVSTTTASQVMRGSGRISQKTREKVLKAAERMNYQRDHQAAAMRSRQFKEIGLLINQIVNPFNAEVVAGVSDRLETNGYLVFILDTRNEPDRQKRYLETLVGGARGGLLWVPSSGTDENMIRFVKAQRIPIITFLRKIPGGFFDHVGIENAAGTHDATEHLISLGHRHIAFLGGEDDNSVRMQRIAGYSEVLRNHDLGDPVIQPCSESRDSSANAVKSLLKDHPEITAIVCNGDTSAMGATLGLRELGLKAGKEISIVGFDGTDASALWIPPLTTLSVNAFGLGETLAQTLLDRIANPDAPVRNINLAASLEIRESTGPLTKK